MRKTKNVIELSRKFEYLFEMYIHFIKFKSFFYNNKCTYITNYVYE